MTYLLLLRCLIENRPRIPAMFGPTFCRSYCLKNTALFEFSYANTKLSPVADRCVTEGIRTRTVTGSVRGDVITVRPARMRALRSSWAGCGCWAEGLDVLLEVWCACQQMSPPIPPSPLISHISFECELICMLIQTAKTQKSTHCKFLRGFLSKPSLLMHSRYSGW